MSGSVREVLTTTVLRWLRLAGLLGQPQGPARARPGSGAGAPGAQRRRRTTHKGWAGRHVSSLDVDNRPEAWVSGGFRATARAISVDLPWIPAKRWRMSSDFH